MRESVEYLLFGLMGVKRLRVDKFRQSWTKYALLRTLRACVIYISWTKAGNVAFWLILGAEVKCFARVSWPFAVTVAHVTAGY